VTLTILALDIEELQGETGKKSKLVIRFKETTKEWVAPKSCGIPMKKMWGTNAASWAGHRITLYPATVDSFGEQVLAIRVRGSPELVETLVWEEQLGRKKKNFTLLPTGKTAPASKPAPAAAPPADPPSGGFDSDDEAELRAEALEREAAEAAQQQTP
jgi:hypothetical protein